MKNTFLFALNYRIISSLNNFSKRFLRKPLCTYFEEFYWITRKRNDLIDDWGTNKNDWIMSYWDSRFHPHRMHLIKEILKYSPESVLEIGCNCGPNLYLLSKEAPNSLLYGLDINEAAINIGNELIKQNSISNVQLFWGKADKLFTFRENEFNIVFTDAVLIYIGADKIRDVILQLLRITRKAIILFEWHDPNCSGGAYGVFDRHWVRDYIRLFEELAPKSKITISKITKDVWPDNKWVRYGAIIEVSDLQ